MHGVLLVIQLVKSIIEGVTEKRTERLNDLTDNLPSDLAKAARYEFKEAENGKLVKIKD